MALRNTDRSYGILAKGFHWLVFVGFVVMYSLGFYMTQLPLGPQMFELISLHKSIGIVILGVVVLRVIWRFANPAPELPQTTPMHLKLLAHLTHFILYGIMIALPLTGWAMSSAANFPVSVFGWFTLPNFVAPSKEALEFLKATHHYIAYFSIALVALHIAAALKHHYVDKDTVLKRMLPFGKGSSQ